MGELGLSGVRERAELHAPDLGADARGEVGDLEAGPQRGGGGEEVRVRGVCFVAGVNVLVGLQGGVFLVGVPGGEVVRVLMGYVSVVAL